MGELLNLYWHKSINFGDMLSPYLLAKFKDVSIEEINYVEADDEKPKYVLTGSILMTPGLTNATIFGAGFVNYSDTFTGSNITLKGVRGFHTLNKLKEFMEVPDDVLIGDPSYCLPLFYDPKPEKKYYLGIIPHIIDYEDYKHISEGHRGEGISVIDLRMQDYETLTQTVERVIFQICQCKAVVSGSLHGLIVAAAYEVPIISRLNGNLLGDGFKFDDYESAGKPDVEKIMEAGCLL